MANGSSKHGDAFADSVRDEFTVLRHHREKIIERLETPNDDSDRPSGVNIHIEQVQAPVKKSLTPKSSHPLPDTRAAAIGTLALAVLSWLGRKIYLLLHH